MYGNPRYPTPADRSGQLNAPTRVACRAGDPVARRRAETAIKNSNLPLTTRRQPGRDVALSRSISGSYASPNKYDR